jgi:CRISPR/Cas system-associated exonuclease Cas4 (RecB family)
VNGVSEIITKHMARLASRRFQNQLGEYHVTDICQCLKRAYLERKKGHDESCQEVWIKQRGNALHRQVTYAFQGWKELPIHMEIAQPLETIRLVGHIDAYDPDEAAIIEFKSTRFVDWQQKSGKLPHKHHVLQLRSYYSIFSGCYGFPVKKLIIAYMDDVTPPLQFEIDPIDISGWLKERTATLHNALLNDIAPEDERGALCKYCAFKDNCGPAQMNAPTLSVLERV